MLFKDTDTECDPDLVPDIQLSPAHITPSLAPSEPLNVHSLVKEVGQPNYRGARIPLSHGLDIAAWRRYGQLLDTDHRITIDMLEFGFPMSYGASHIPATTDTHHKSATCYPDHVDKYLATEIEHRAIYGPLQVPPFEWFITSPLMTRDKSNSTDRRVIMDLSFPPGRSVNDGIDPDSYLGQPFKLTLPSALSLKDAIREKGSGCYLWSRDLKRGYRQLRVCPLDYPLLGIKWRGAYYMDTAVCFGIRYGAKCMQDTTNLVTDIMQHEGHECLNYIDDIAGIHCTHEGAAAAFTRCQSLMRELGLQEAESKSSEPSTMMVWLGVQFDTVAMIMSIPQAKIDTVITLAREWLCRAAATTSQLRSWLGKLFHVATCSATLRLFVNRMLQTLRTARPNGHVLLDQDFKEDVKWILEFLPAYNGVDVISKPPNAPYELIVDSCLSGCGGYYGLAWYHASFPHDVLARDYSISQLEMLNVLVALRLLGDDMAGTIVHIRCDNAAAVSVGSFGAT